MTETTPTPPTQRRPRAEVEETERRRAPSVMDARREALQPPLSEGAAGDLTRR